MNRIDHSRYIHPFASVSSVELDNGYIVWRIGTGYNAELLHIRTYTPGLGTGRELIKAMLQDLLENDPPYATVFGFTRYCNEGARAFYQSVGFELTTVPGVYADGIAILFSQSFAKLLEHHNVK